MNRQKFLIDTDTGVDDALGLLYALLLPSVDVVGVTSIFGNVSVDLTTRNSLYLLEHFASGDVPCARGAGKPLIGQTQFHPEIHGDDGVGNANLPEPTIQATDMHAAQLIAKLAAEHPGELEIVALGPLTNLALAAALDPNLAANIRRVVWMGGAVAASGNVTAAAEADAWHDPEAAQMVLEAGWPIVMVGLDVTDTTILTHDRLMAISASHTPAADYAAAITPAYMDFYSTFLPTRGCAMHSPLAVAIAAHPDLVLSQVEVPTCVDLNSGPSRGATITDRRGRDFAREKWPIVTSIMAVDSEKFLNHFEAVITAPHPQALVRE